MRSQQSEAAVIVVVCCYSKSSARGGCETALEARPRPRQHSNFGSSHIGSSHSGIFFQKMFWNAIKQYRRRCTPQVYIYRFKGFWFLCRDQIPNLQPIPREQWFKRFFFQVYCRQRTQTKWYFEHNFASELKETMCVLDLLFSAKGMVIQKVYSHMHT